MINFKQNFYFSNVDGMIGVSDCNHAKSISKINLLENLTSGWITTDTIYRSRFASNFETMLPSNPDVILSKLMGDEFE